MDSQCIAYQFNGSTKKNCGVIHGNSTEESGRKFTSEDGDNVFRKGITHLLCSFRNLIKHSQKMLIFQLYVTSNMLFEVHTLFDCGCAKNFFGYSCKTLL